MPLPFVRTRWSLSAFAALALASGIGAQDPARVPDFARDVWPILDARCLSCHGPQKNGREPKGGLRLDGVDWIRRGGDGGTVVTAGDPDDSPLYTLTTLDKDDPDIMPAKGAPLTAEQRETLRAWIAAGADFGAWTGSAGPGSRGAEADSPAEAPLPPHRQRWLELAQGLEPLAASRLEELRKIATVRPVLPDSPLLRVRVHSRDGAIDAGALRSLRGLAEHAVELDLSRVQLPGNALRGLGRWPRLEHLSLAHSSFRAGLPSAEDLPKLRSLNLFSTGVGSAILEELDDRPALVEVFLGGTALPQGMLREWASARPQVRIIGAPALPPPAPDDEPQPRRRR